VEVTSDGLTPAEHRALRELYAAARQLVAHWGALERALDGEAALAEGAAAGRELLAELPAETAPHGVHGRVAAQGVGVQLASARNAVGDAFLERNQALRIAVLDVQHVCTLLGYLERLATARGDGDLAAFHAAWGERLGQIERVARDAAMGAGDDPDAAVEPVRRSVIGKLAHGAANAVGTAGEWTDRRIGRARAR
jgi:hypothetical protein